MSVKAYQLVVVRGAGGGAGGGSPPLLPFVANAWKKGGRANEIDSLKERLRQTMHHGPVSTPKQPTGST